MEMRAKLERCRRHAQNADRGNDAAAVDRPKARSELAKGTPKLKQGTARELPYRAW